ncbi:MAG TPA: glycosyltransferase, partial [Mucilaginibacter sp.]
DLVIRAFLELNKSDPSNYTLILIGGPDSIHKTGLTESEEREYLDCNQIIKAGFTQNVEYYLSIADIFLFPSLKEGMPICIIEALAMGVPTITADSRGCNDLVVNSKNGILLSATPTVEEIIEALTFLKENPLVLKEFKENALKRRVSLSRDLYIERQIDVYSNLAKP